MTTVILSVVFLHTAVKGHEIFGGVVIAVGLLVTIYAKGLERRGSSNAIRAKQNRYNTVLIYFCVVAARDSAARERERERDVWVNTRAASIKEETSPEAEGALSGDGCVHSTRKIRFERERSTALQARSTCVAVFSA